MDARRIILEQIKAYPGLVAADAVKALYQSVFGCGHLLNDEAGGFERLVNEWNAPAAGAAVEALGDEYCRVHIGPASAMGLVPETLFKLFKLSCAENGERAAFDEAISTLVNMCDAGEVAFDRREVAYIADGIRISNYAPISHSPRFKSLYAPSYRVVRREYGEMLPILCGIDRLKGQRPIIAIEGECASGKTTLARLLGRVYDCNVHHMDDFFPRPFQRTSERMRLPGGNIDHERFLEEVLLPIKAGGPFSYRRFDCSKMALGEEIKPTPARLNVVEGAYSMHPELSGHYDYSIFMKADLELRLKRILERNGPEALEKFKSVWIPLEDAYFAATGAQGRCDIVVDNWEVSV